MSFTISDATPEGKKFLEELKKLADLEVVVGFQDSQTYDDGTSLPEIAAYNEYGSSDTPARPFMRRSFERHEDELQKACDRVNQVLAKGGTAEAALKELGVFLKGLVQEEIVDGGFAPNAPATVKKKKSDRPLIDTGYMRQSVQFVVRRGGSSS